MFEAILAIFSLALLAPGLQRVAPRAAGPVLAAAVALVVVWLAGYWPSVAAGEPIRTSFPWFATLNVHLSFMADGLGLLFGLLITGIGSLIVLYASGYMAGHADLGRLYAFLLAFMASMLGVAFSDNILTLFVFWELTSLTSFFLIGFNHETKTARYAAWQAMLVTVGGGLAMLAGLLLLSMIGDSFSFSELAGRGDVITAHPLYLPMLVLILVGAFTKSAQFPFHFWLPNAMEAPTPVSAYLHSATMVKAGVYLLARLHPALGGTDAWFGMVAGVGATTMLVGAVLSLTQHDLKRILAYSTVSILGALTMLIGIGTPKAAQAAAVLVLAHALYKAPLFLVAGAIDHETGTRDIRHLGGLWKVMPVTAKAAMVALVSSAGLPPLFGFIAKEGMYLATPGGPSAGVLLTAVAVLASMFLVAVFLLIAVRPFFGPFRAPKEHPHEAPPSMWLGPVLLASAGLLLGLVPWLVEPLIGGATSSILGEPTPARLYLWHGFNTALLLSVVTLAGGIGLFFVRETLLSRLSGLAVLGRLGPDRWYDWAMQGLVGLATWQTRMVQSGYLRYYMMIIMGMMILLTGATLASGGKSLDFIDFLEVKIYEALLVALIVAGSIVTAVSNSRLVAVAALGVVGYGVAMIYILYGAPDLAMTQFSIETLTVILFVLVLYRLPRFVKLTSKVVRIRDLALSLLAGGVVTAILLVITAEPTQSLVSPFFAENSVPLGKGRNVVNVILVDFRALDTLGEITVLGIAAIGVWGLMRLRMHEHKEGETPKS